ncbi:MAG: hypothetical protein E7291_01505 [Lachnospiraceae bacterium]|nr:hypothetical protein [Lachnospiraceae bacterium]
MRTTVYEDYKYHMQDTGNLYIGAKYTLENILDEEEITFKFRLIVERYILPEADLQDTLETHLYYLEPKSFLVKIYKQLKAKVKINIIEEKRSVLGGSKKQYTTKMIKVEELAAMSVEEKEQKGVVVQELRMSKLALMAF